MAEIKAVLSDGGYIVFDDTATKKKPFLAISKHLPKLTYPKFREMYIPFKIQAQTQENYNSADAMRDYLKLIGYPQLYEVVKGELDGGKMPLMPHVKETLEALYSGGTSFIILTDATKKSEELRKGLVKAGIDAYVKDVISSKDIGVRKPDPYFFNFALAKHSLKKEDVFFFLCRIGLRIYRKRCPRVFNQETCNFL